MIAKQPTYACLGFSSYDNYLRSNLWRRIRKRVLARDGGTCLCCGEPAQHVHHTDYSIDVMSGECDAKLVSLCERCHNQAEYGPDWQKRTLKQANSRIVPHVPWLRLSERGHVELVESVESPRTQTARQQIAPKKKRKKKRNATIKSLGYSDFRDFVLNSDEWRQLADRVLERDNGMCQCCLGNADTAYQFKRDKRILNGTGGDSSAVSICFKCLNSCRYDTKGVRLSPRTVRRGIFSRMVAVSAPAIGHISAIGTYIRKHCRSTC